MSVMHHLPPKCVWDISQITARDPTGVLDVPTRLSFVVLNDIPVHAALVMTLFQHIVGECVSCFQHLV